MEAHALRANIPRVSFTPCPQSEKGALHTRLLSAFSPSLSRQPHIFSLPPSPERVCETLSAFYDRAAGRGARYCPVYDKAPAPIFFVGHYGWTFGTRSGFLMLFARSATNCRFTHLPIMYGNSVPPESEYAPRITRINTNYRR
jgi:hypothetical protein